MHQNFTNSIWSWWKWQIAIVSNGEGRENINWPNPQLLAILHHHLWSSGELLVKAWCPPETGDLVVKICSLQAASEGEEMVLVLLILIQSWLLLPPRWHFHLLIIPFSPHYQPVPLSPHFQPIPLSPHSHSLPFSLHSHPFPCSIINPFSSIICIFMQCNEMPQHF